MAPPDASSTAGKADAAAGARPAFDDAVAARLTPEEQKGLNRVRWINRMTSLWAPVTLFGIVFLAYVFLVELDTPTYVWAQPALKAFGLVMLGAFVGLGGVRLFLSPFKDLRKDRHQGFELLAETATLADKHRPKLTPKAWDELTTQCAALCRAMVGDRAQVLDEQLRATVNAADKHLAAWRKQSVFDFGMGFVKAVVVALVIRAIIIEPFKIPSGSMIPTLHIGDQIFVNKFIYGVRIPFMNKVPFVLIRPPKRGDVIVFNNPVETDKDFIKRVIGVPGDTITIVDEVIYVNGVAQPRESVDPDFTYYDDERGEWEGHQVAVYREHLSGVTHLTAEGLLHPHGAMTEGPFVVPPGHVFVMGDNRDNSLDSRYGLGGPRHVVYVPYGNIKGKAMVIWLSLGYGGLFSGAFGGTGLRLDRFFLPVR